MFGLASQADLYLNKFVPALLHANNNNLNDFDKCLNEKANVECVKKFLSESQVRTLIIQKFMTKDEEEGEQISSVDEPSQYLISTEVQYTNPKCLR